MAILFISKVGDTFTKHAEILNVSYFKYIKGDSLKNNVLSEGLVLTDEWLNKLVVNFLL